MEEGVFTESINYASLKQLPILFACEDNKLAIHTFQDARTPNTSYEKRIESYGLKTSSFTYKKPNELSLGISEAINEVRNGSPHFLIVNCYRWKEHVGVGYDWNLGYRDKNDLDDWKKFDLETNPSLWGFDKEYINSVNVIVKKRVNKIFSESQKKERALNSSLLNNIY